MNYIGIWAIYRTEMARTMRTISQSIVSPILTTMLYFVVFGSAIGSRINTIDDISYGSFIVPGMVMLTILGQSLSNASFAIYFPRFIGYIYEILAAPLSLTEIVIGYVAAASTKSIILGAIVLITANFCVDYQIAHPFWMLFFLLMTSVVFSLIGFIIGLWATNFEKLQLIPILIINPLIFLGGSFYSIKMLPEIWQNISFLNPILYLINGLRWSFYESSDVSFMTSVGVVLAFALLAFSLIVLIVRKGYRLQR